MMIQNIYYPDELKKLQIPDQPLVEYECPHCEGGRLFCTGETKGGAAIYECKDCQTMIVLLD